jgi:hypothetical protein
MYGVAVVMENGSMKSDEAVNWRSFDQTLRQVREAFADLPDDELKSLIDEAVASVRAKKSIANAVRENSRCGP